jgi:hypothetical protein
MLAKSTFCLENRGHSAAVDRKLAQSPGRGYCRPQAVASF